MSPEFFTTPHRNKCKHESLQLKAPLDTEELHLKSQKVALKNFEPFEEPKSFNFFRNLKPFRKPPVKEELAEPKKQENFFRLFRKSLARKKNEAASKPSLRKKTSFKIPPLLIPSHEDSLTPKGQKSLTARLSDSDSSSDLFSLKTDRSDLLSRLSSLRFSISEREIFPEFEKIMHNGQNLKKKQEEFGIQDPEVSFYTFQAIEIAKLLFSKTGAFRKDCLLPIIDFFNPESPPLNYEASLLSGLKALQENEDIIRVLNHIEAPKKQTSQSSFLIRLTLDLEAYEPVTDRHAKIVAAAALLSHLRQGFQGSCFATHLAISELSNNPLNCMLDFKSLLKKGALIRSVDGVKKPFPFLLKTGEQSLNQNVSLNEKGALLFRPDLKMWNALPLAKALRAGGIQNHRSAVKKALQSFNLPNNVPLHELLEILAKEALQLEVNKGKCLSQVYCRMAFAFESAISNPLLHAFENSLAEMSESNDRGMITKPVIHSITKPLQAELESGVKIKKRDKKASNALLSAIKSVVVKRIHLHYDPDVSYSISQDLEHPLNESGFILYDTRNSAHPSKWARVDSPEYFKKFVLDIIDQAYKNISSGKKEGKDEFLNLAKHLQAYVNTSLFLLEALTRFYPENLKTKDLISSWRTLPFTPWRVVSGNIGETVREIYKDSKTANKKKALEPKDVEKYLFDLVSFQNKHEYLLEKNIITKKHCKIPVYTKNHAFNLLFGHPSFSLLSNENIEESIKNLSFTAKELSENELNQEEIEVFFTKLTEALPEQKQALLEAQKIMPKNSSFSLLRSKVIQIMPSCYPKDGLTFLVDSAIGDSLPDRIRRAMQRNSIHIADTNWKHGIQDIHFCVSPHPGTGKLGLFEIQDDGNKISPIHDFWILENPWEFYYSPRSHIKEV